MIAACPIFIWCRFPLSFCRGFPRHVLFLCFVFFPLSLARSNDLTTLPLVKVDVKPESQVGVGSPTSIKVMMGASAFAGVASWPSILEGKQ